FTMVFGTGVSKWVTLAALVAILWVARGVLPPFIVAGILAYVFYPLVDELALYSGVRREWVAIAVFVLLVAALVTFGWLIGARLASELRDLAREGPNIIETVVEHLTGGQNVELFGQTVSSLELGRRVDIAIRDELGTPTQAIQAVRLGFEII